MKWLIRTTIALGLLACLGYASYAFGMFVLSKKLFGDSVMQNSTSDVSRSATVTKSVTRKSRDKNAQGGAEVNVLAARDAGPGPEAPSLDALERETRARDYDAPRTPSRQRIISADSLKTVTPKRDASRNDSSNNNSSASDGTNSDENRPRKRRRRRRRSTTETTTTSTTARNDAASSASSSDASTRDTTSSSRNAPDSSDERPSRRRESSSDSGGSSRREKRIESPVPGGGAKSDGGSSGSESPVPVPE